MSSIEIAPANPNSQVRNNEFAEMPSGAPDAGKRFGDLMDRTLARTNQKPPDRDSQSARKTAKKDSSQSTAKVADGDDTDTRATSDDKHKVAATQQKTDDSANQPAVVPPSQFFPVIVEMLKSAGTQANGDAESATTNNSSSVCISPVDLQVSSSRALLGLQAGTDTAKSAANGAATTALPSNDSRMGKDALAALAANNAKADAQSAANPDEAKTAKSGHQHGAKGTDASVSPNGSVSDEKADNTLKSLAKNGIGNSFLSSAELATTSPGNADGKPDKGENPNKTGVSADQNPNGISAAQQDAQMKKAYKKNKNAGAAEKVLPEIAVSSDAGENLPAADKVSASPITFDRLNHADNSALNTVSQDRPVEAASTSVDKVSVSSSVVDIRARAVERAGDIMMLHSTRLNDMSADTLKVTIRPGAGIELAVELHHGEKGIEATATLKNGDYQFLKSNWSDLQQRLEARGVRLSSLANSGPSTNGNAGQFQQPHRQAGQQQDDPAFAGAFAEFVMAGSIAKQAVQTVSTRGFESWA